MSEQTMTGRTIGGAYRITGFQRAGRMGDIYLARRVENNEIVSIKLMDSEMFAETEAVRRFERETRITTKLNHPCSLVVLDFGRTEEGLPFMVTEYVEGELLSDVIEEREKLEPQRAAYIAAQIAMALDAAHAIGVIHRDLAPTNILITDAHGQADSVKVVEFGLSRLEETQDGVESSTLTAVGVRIGTPTYMAPEYIDEYKIDHRADLYSLGIVLYEMLTGSPPFTGRPYKVMDRHLNEVPAPVSSTVQGVPAWIDAVVAKLLEKEPDNRPQSAAEVVEQIEKGLGERLQTVKVAEAGTPVPVPREQASAGPDPLLAKFIEVQVDSVTPGSGGVDPTEALVVHRVAAESIAAHAGVHAGLLCTLPDEPTAGMRDPRLWRQNKASRHYVFASRDGSKRIDLRCTGADIGVDFVRSGEHVAKHFDPAHPDNDALLELWLQGDWPTLGALSSKALSRQKGAAGVLNTGLFSRFLGRKQESGSEIRERDQPALAMYGAALIEQGQVNEGLELVREYSIQHADGHPKAFNGIALFYEAVDREKMGQEGAAIDLLVQAWLHWPNKRSSDRIHHLTGKYPDNRAWYGQRFPDYTLDSVMLRGRTVSLSSRLVTMAEHQVWLVVLLGGERANAQYEDVMRRFLAFGTHFNEFIDGIHVVTDTVNRDPAHPEWTAAEDEAIAAKMDLELLEDYRGFLRRAVKPGSSPTVYAVSKGGIVVHEGSLGSVELWEMLLDVSKLRRRR